MRKGKRFIAFCLALLLNVGMINTVTAKASDSAAKNDLSYSSFLETFDAYQQTFSDWQRISFQMMGQTGYIKIGAFTDTTYQQVKTVTDHLQKAGVSSVIVDVRNNAGGDLYGGIDTANIFVPQGDIATVLLDGKYPVLYYSVSETTPFHVVVLVNALTASAAELFASAVQESGAGRLVGVNTYGKSSIQKVTVQEDGTVTRQTVGRYLTRNHEDIGGKGLAPDDIVFSEYPPTGNDKQLEEALKMALYNSVRNAQKAWHPKNRRRQAFIILRKYPFLGCAGYSSLYIHHV